MRLEGVTRHERGGLSPSRGDAAVQDRRPPRPLSARLFAARDAPIRTRGRARDACEHGQLRTCASLWYHIGVEAVNRQDDMQSTVHHAPSRNPYHVSLVAFAGAECSHCHVAVSYLINGFCGGRVTRTIMLPRHISLKAFAGAGDSQYHVALPYIISGLRGGRVYRTSMLPCHISRWPLRSM